MHQYEWVWELVKEEFESKKEYYARLGVKSPTRLVHIWIVDHLHLRARKREKHAGGIKEQFKERFTVMYFHEYAKVWSKRLRFSPQKVGGTFNLEDGDTVEIHMK